MAKRKPLPYHASQGIDLALMAISTAVRALMPVVEQPTTAEERSNRIARAIHAMHQAKENLQDIRRNEQGE